jgi:hypothetical protein
VSKHVGNHAELYKRDGDKLIHTDTPDAIAKEYEEFSPGMRTQYFIKHNGRIYEGDDVRELLDI